MKYGLLTLQEQNKIIGTHQETIPIYDSISKNVYLKVSNMKNYSQFVSQYFF